MKDAVSTIKPVGRSRLVNTVVDQLRTLILAGDLPPGQTLPQIELSERLGVSRTPLREAFRILEHEGFVRMSNSNNTLEVVDLTIDEMIQLYQMREVIDGLAARLAAARRDERALHRLDGILEAMTQFGSAEDWPHRAMMHADFHACIAEMSGNQHVIAQLPMIRLSSQMLSRKLGSMDVDAPVLRADMVEESQQDHVAILDALRAGDARRAETVARRHIRKTLRSRLLKGDLLEAIAEPVTQAR
jgi:GntR family transcriptional regulator of vanillate catabolism